jgi:polyisoprenoid-binding protein YceI
MLKRLLIAVGAAAVIGIIGVVSAGAVWYFALRESADLATEPQAIPSALLQPATATASSATGPTPAASTATNGTLAYVINSDSSEAAYFVDEELATVGLPSTAKGATTAVSGTLYLTADGTALAADKTSQFTVDLTGLTSDKSQRDGRVQQALQTSQYPEATFTITGVTGYDPAIAEGQTQTLQLTGTLDLHGVQKPVTWEVKAFREGNVVSALATTTVSFSEFNVTAPTFAGLVSIDDKATLQVQLIAEAA